MHVWIVEIGESIPGIDAGAREWRCGMLSRSLIDRGHSVTWWASTFYHTQKRHRFDASCTVDMTPDLRIRFLHGPGYAQNRSLRRALHHRMLANEFAVEALDSQKPDIVFCCLPTLELADRAVQFGNATNVPVIIDIRDLWPDHFLTLVPGWARGLAKAALFTETRRASRLLRDAFGITAISEDFLKWGLQHARREQRECDGVFYMSYPPLSPTLEAQISVRQEDLIKHYGLQPSDSLITFVGTFVSSFSLGTVIEAARGFYRSGQRNIRFMLVGSGDAGAYLRSQAAGLDNVIFTGWLDQLSITALLKLSVVGLAPYRDGASMSLPNKPFEYMAAELPLLSSLRGTLEDLIRKEQIGLQYQSEDATSLTEKILWLVEHPEERVAMGKRAGKLFEERFRADIVYSRLATHLEWMVEIKRNA